MESKCFINRGTKPPLLIRYALAAPLLVIPDLAVALYVRRMYLSFLRYGHSLICGSLVARTTVRTIQLAVVKIAPSKDLIFYQSDHLNLIASYSAPLCRVIPVQGVAVESECFSD